MADDPAPVQDSVQKLETLYENLRSQHNVLRREFDNQKKEFAEYKKQQAARDAGQDKWLGKIKNAIWKLKWWGKGGEETPEVPPIKPKGDSEDEEGDSRDWTFLGFLGCLLMIILLLFVGGMIGRLTGFPSYVESACVSAQQFVSENINSLFPLEETPEEKEAAAIREQWEKEKNETLQKKEDK